MSVKLEQELQRFLGLTLAIEEENGKYVLTNDQLETLLNKYRVLLRHQNLKTAQLYLGKVTDSEAIRWMDILHGE